MMELKGGDGPAQTAQRLPETGKRKYPDRFVVLRGKKFLVDARIERADWFEVTERKRGLESALTPAQVRRKLEADGRQQRKMTLPSAESREQRLEFTQARQNWPTEDWEMDARSCLET